MSEIPAVVPKSKVGTFDLTLWDRSDGIVRVTMELTADVAPVVGEAVTLRVIEVVREVVDR